MISAYRIKLDSCNGCHKHDRVVEFKIVPVVGGSGMLIRFCRTCRGELRQRLFEMAATDADVKGPP